MEKLNGEILKNNKTVDFLIGHSYFMKQDALVDVINKKIIPLLNEYFRGDMNVVENILTSCLTAINTISIDKEWKDKMQLIKVKYMISAAEARKKDKEEELKGKKEELKFVKTP